MQSKFDLRFCFLIDGLGEFAGLHVDIIAFVKEMASHPKLKVCVSRRPLAVFDRALVGLLQLVLQNLTIDDIRVYTTNKLTNNELRRELKIEEPGPGAELANIIKASGVFLWVRIVVESLLAGLESYDASCDLKRRLEELPPDIEDLYWHMINQVKPKWYLEQGFRLLRMVQAAGGTSFANPVVPGGTEHGCRLRCLEERSIRREATYRPCVGG